MSKHLIPVNAIQTTREEFNKEDEQALMRNSTFSGFENNSLKIAKIFSEFTDNTDYEAFTLPEKVGEASYWPEHEVFMANADKRKAYFFPHCFIPKVLFALQPVAALRAGIFYIFKLIFGIESERQTKCCLAKANEKLFGPFQIYFDMVLSIWTQGYPSNIPTSLGNFWQDEMISDLIENITSGTNTCLSLNPKMITAYGLNPLCSENVQQAQSKAHLKLCKRNSKISSLLCLLSRECMLCGIDFPTDNEIRVHLETECLKTYFNASEENGITFYSCAICASVKMPYAQIVEHATTFCSRNFRTRCIYCYMLNVRCKCTAHRITLMAIVYKMLGECKNFDLHNNAHRYISHIYSVYKMQLITENLDEKISTGIYEEKQLKSIPLINIQFNEGVQTHSEDGNNSFHIVQQSSCGINNDIPLSYLINSLEDAGNSLDVNLIKYYSENSESNQCMFLQQIFT